MKIHNDKWSWLEEMQEGEEVKIKVTSVKQNSKGSTYICANYEGKHFKANISPLDGEGLEPGKEYIMTCTSRSYNQQQGKYFHKLSFRQATTYNQKVLEEVMEEIASDEEQIVKERAVEILENRLQEYQNRADAIKYTLKQLRGY